MNIGDTLTVDFRGEPHAARVVQVHPDGTADLHVQRPGHAAPALVQFYALPEAAALPAEAASAPDDAPPAGEPFTDEEYAEQAEAIVHQHTVKSLEEFLSGCDDPRLLAAMKAAEQARENPRGTAVNAIEERIGELETPA